MSDRRLVLASQSPRRRLILTMAGFEFDILPSQISEIPDENLNLTSRIRQLAHDKAEACLKMRTDLKGQGFLLLSADTVVVLDDQVLGKPKDENEARTFLRRLSGRRHDVITAVCLVDIDTGRWSESHAVTAITFRTLTDHDIDTYVASGDPMDKAGAYGIQGGAAGFVSKIEGELDNVVGLPMDCVDDGMRELGVSVARRGLVRRREVAESLHRVLKVISGTPVAQTATGTGAATLVAVSKTRPAIDVVSAVLAGQFEFGENYAQEALAKMNEVEGFLELLPREQRKPVRWHFIGGLQSKKVKSVVGRFALIHSVDRTSLLEEIDKRAREAGVRQEVLLQINLGDEATKSGVARDKYLSWIDEVARLELRSVELRGVMALPPLVDDEKQARSQFADVRRLFEHARERLPAALRPRFDQISMGTTQDFHWALREGATIVRVGTAIFGEREDAARSATIED